MGSLQNPGGRVSGFDLARGVAIFVMLLIDFQTFFSVCETFPGWLFRAVEFMDRRAAVVLVMVSGAGASLMFSRNGVQKSRQPILERAVFLLLTGSVLAQIWQADILHYYGIFLLLGLLVSRFSNASLLFSAAGVWLAGLCQLMDPVINYLSLFSGFSFAGLFSNLLITGYYPLIPWAGFYLFGMWLGRQEVTRIRFQSMLMAAGLLLVILSQAAMELLPAITARMALGFGVSGQQVVEVLKLAVKMAWMDLTIPTPLAVISGLGTGICVIMASFMLAGFARHAPAACFITAGKNTLSLYVVHILFIRLIEHLPGMDEDLPLLPVLGGAVLFFTAYMHLLGRWLKTHTNGPLEWAMRHFPFIDEKVLWTKAEQGR